MRNFGFVQSDSDTRAQSKIANHDIAIITIAAFGAVTVAFSIYALAFGFGAARGVSGFLSFLP